MPSFLRLFSGCNWYNNNYVLCTYVGIKDVIVPPKLKKHGRPKGTEKAVIKLPAMKRKAKLVIPFLKKLPAEKEKVLS